MDYSTIISAIGSVGFPIVACCGLFWMINTTMKELTGSIEALNKTVSLLNTNIQEKKLESFAGGDV